jgi:hypothetical protein
MSGFDFPRDERSSVEHIDLGAIRTSVLKLVNGMESAFKSASLDALTADMGGWTTHDVCATAAACAFLKGIDPATDYDAALVRQALIEQIVRKHDIDPEIFGVRDRGPTHP